MGSIENDYVRQAQRVIESQRQPNGEFRLTTTQLRGLLSLTAQILDDAEAEADDNISEGLYDKLQYLRVRIVYQAGRESAVKAFVEKAKLLEALQEVGRTRRDLIRFCRYMEALTAYKKFYDPTDK